MTKSYVDGISEAHFIVREVLDVEVAQVTFCWACKGWIVYEPDAVWPPRIEWATCSHVDVCPDCKSNSHPGCCGPFA